MANRFLLLLYRAVPLLRQCPEPIALRCQFFSLLEGADILPDIIPVIRRSGIGYLADDLPDDTPDIRSRRGGRQGRMSGPRRPLVSADFASLGQGDKDTDNPVVADLTRPVFAADKSLG